MIELVGRALAQSVPPSLHWLEELPRAVECRVAQLESSVAPSVFCISNLASEKRCPEYGRHRPH